MSMTSKDRSRSRGVTTLETLVGASLSLVVLGIAGSFSVAQQHALAVEDTYASAQGVTRTALDLMARELRMASYDPTGTALPLSTGITCAGVRQGFTEATPTRIRFKQDLNGDGDLLDSNENLVYELSEGAITRQDVTGSAVEVVTGVPSNGLTIRYYDGSNPPLALAPQGNPPALTASQRDCVNKVEVVIAASLANPNPQLSQPVTATGTIEVAVRSRSLSSF